MTNEMIKSRSELDDQVAHTPGMRLYGPTKGHTSLYRVTAGIADGLKEVGFFAGFCPTNRDSERDSSVDQGALSFYAIHEGTPGGLRKMRAYPHKQTYAMLALNSNYAPDWLLKDIIRGGSKIVTPSAWSQSVLEEHVGSENVALYKHGVAPGFRVDPELLKERRKEANGKLWRAAHFTSSPITGPDVQSRKGTVELIMGWAGFMQANEPETRKGKKFELHIYQTGGSAGVLEAIREWCWSFQHSVVVHDQVNLPPNRMAYLYQQFHAVVQPSRGEGFGMIPLEARACGVPVIATSCTGHSEHINDDTPGVRIIETGELQPVADGPGAVAPSLSDRAVEHALVDCYQWWETISQEAAEEAPHVHTDWSWGKVTKEWLVTEGILSG
jgi:glycosyltransferase involved in cell wall biosynthesis